MHWIVRWLIDFDKARLIVVGIVQQFVEGVVKLLAAGTMVTGGSGAH